MSAAIRLATMAAAGLLITACGGPAGPPAASPGATPPAASSGQPSVGPASSAPPAPSPSPSPAPAPFGYQPLYPFGSLAEVQAWQAGYVSGGHQPWHLSADQTALAFTQGYLGFGEVGQVASHTVGTSDARVTVGLRLPNGTISHAATIHLVKYGSGRYTPWEVVGTDDTTLTLDVPRYGAVVTSPVRVAGTITGVDESLGVEVRTLASEAAVGTYCCRAAGGQAAPWSVSVAFHAAPGQVITIVVHTGGHVAAVERFAVTGARAG